jgi:glutamate 5-kinase
LEERAYRRIVIKLGTALLTGVRGELDRRALAQLIAQVAKLHRGGLEAALVTSGAIAAGKHRLGLGKERKDIPTRQVMASVGQNRLMQLYEKLFDRHGIIIAQALLTKVDIGHRASYLNARNTLLALLGFGVVPIVNENDVVAIDEIKETSFGDNDNLSAMVANLIDADLLVLLGEVAGLYSADPKLDPKAGLIPRVDAIDARIHKLAAGTSTTCGTGGMATKIQAAKLATASGTAVIIADGREKDILIRLVNGEAIGTFFSPTATRMESRKRWMMSGVSSKGKVVIDDGAASAIKERDGSLLPAGIHEADGKFERGQVIDITDCAGRRIACGISNYASSDIDLIKGVHSGRIEGLLGYKYGDEVVHRNNLVLL